jgi:hypothetical protein
MTERPAPGPDRSESGRYEIRLTGHLDAHWTAWFDGLTVSHENDGTSVISGQIVDQAALHGLLQRVRDLGLPLVSVRKVDNDEPIVTTPNAPSAQPTSKEL